MGGMDFGNLARPTIDPKQVLRAVIQASGWTVTEAGEVWNVSVPCGALRKQVVRVKFDQKDGEGNPVVAYASTCGPATPENASALLRYNTQLVHGAFAFEKTDAGEFVVIQANQLAGTIDPAAASKILSAVAWQADKAEEKLTGGDVY